MTSAVVALAGFAGAWLLVAAPVYQARPEAAAHAGAQQDSREPF